jgi:hypothetical protein
MVPFNCTIRSLKQYIADHLQVDRRWTPLLFLEDRSTPDHYEFVSGSVIDCRIGSMTEWQRHVACTRFRHQIRAPQFRRPSTRPVRVSHLAAIIASHRD